MRLHYALAIFISDGIKSSIIRLGAFILNVFIDGINTAAGVIVNGSTRSSAAEGCDSPSSPLHLQPLYPPPHTCSCAVTTLIGAHLSTSSLPTREREC